MSETSGPWWIGQAGDICTVFYLGRPDVIHHVEGRDNAEKLRDKLNAAELVRDAAPALLAALHEIVNDYENGSGVCGCREIAKAAIKLAEPNT